MSRLLISTSVAALLAMSGAAIAQTPKSDARPAQQAPATKDSAPAVGGAATEAIPAPAPDGKAPGKNAQEKASPDTKTAQGSAKQDAPAKEGKAAAAEKAPAADPERAKEPAKKTANEPTKSPTEAQKSSTERTGGSPGQAAVQLQPEQRTQVQTVFSKHKSQAITNVNVQVNVGVAVPRNVQLVAVPEDIVVIVPQYRRYRYFVIENSVCIVDPDTYVIVDVIVLT